MNDELMEIVVRLPDYSLKDLKVFLEAVEEEVNRRYAFYKMHQTWKKNNLSRK